MKTLSIDLETKSGADLKKTGVYRYCEDKEFSILLFGVSVDGGEPVTYDLAAGEHLPDDLLHALVDDRIIKWAFNASFERVAISYWLRKCHPDIFRGYQDLPYLNPVSWRCSLVLSAYNGLPLSLQMVGAVLGFDKQKLKEGHNLIRYFCTSCTPTKSNDGRTWNRPSDAPEKWALFKKYNIRDVEVELQIHNRLKNYMVPDSVWEEYFIDQSINDRGIMIDRELVQKAIALDAKTKDALMISMQNLTGLDNPNSGVQLKGWLDEQGLPMESLGKKEVMAAIPNASEEIGTVLSLRLQSAKSSVKKYQAMENSVCMDNRCHGMFFFYGANRTGRFSGRIVQLQNLPQNHMPDLEEARTLVKQGDYDLLSTLYDNIPNVLSELIRTAFIPRPGYKFIVSDYSSIEARVLAYLSNETHVMKSFQEGKDLYCATASAMFGVPVVKHGVNGELRQKGKIATLACIAAGQLVLTDHGLVPIENVTMEMKVWDGENYVSHEGVIYKGEKEVITYDGLTATKDHLVFTEGRSDPIPFAMAKRCGEKLEKTGDGRHPIRVGENHLSGKAMEQDLESFMGTGSVHRMRNREMDRSSQSSKWTVKRMPALFSKEKDPALAGPETYRSKTALRESKRPKLCKLRRAGDKVLLSIRHSGRLIFDGCLRYSRSVLGDRPYQYERKLRARQYSLCDQSSEFGEPKKNGLKRVLAGILALCKKRRYTETESGPIQGRNHTGCQESCGREAKGMAPYQRTARLYDIRNAGPHHRFTVSGVLVHNCGYGGSVGALKAMGALDMGLKEEELQSIVDRWRDANPHIVAFWWAVDRAVKDVVKYRTTTTVGCLKFYWKSGMLMIDLPSGRRLSYVKPAIGENKFGGESVTYMGIDAKKKWARLESYGPKFVENITQAIARDVLCYAMRNLRDLSIVGHVHDELIIEVPESTDLKTVCDIMGETPPWAPGLLLRADGYECAFYKKD